MEALSYVDRQRMTWLEKVRGVKLPNPGIRVAGTYYDKEPNAGLLLTSDGRWEVRAIDGNGAWMTGAPAYSSADVGYTFAENAGEALGPFTLMLKDSGLAVLVNRLGLAAWSSGKTCMTGHRSLPCACSNEGLQ